MKLILLRRLTQMTVIVLFCILPWLNAAGFYHLSGSLFAFDFFGLPFADPASALQAAAGALSSGMFVGSMLCFGTLLALFVALVLGRIFCGWLCPYGFFSEMVLALRRKLLPAKQDKWSAKIAWLSRIIILLAGLVLVFFWGYPLISLLSMPGELSLLPLDLWAGAALSAIILACALPLLALVLEFVFGKRLWCRYVCPQSALLGAAAGLLPKKAPGLRIVYDAHKCTCGKESPCRQACGMGLNPRKKNGPERRDCMMCGDCVSVCASYGQALGWRGKKGN